MRSKVAFALVLWAVGIICTSGASYMSSESIETTETTQDKLIQMDSRKASQSPTPTHTHSRPPSPSRAATITISVSSSKSRSAAISPSHSPSSTPSPSASKTLSNVPQVAANACSSAPQGSLSNVMIDVASGVVRCDHTPTSCGAPFFVEVVYESTVVGATANMTCSAVGTALSLEISIQTDPLLQGSSTTVTVQVVNSCGVGPTFVAAFVDQAIDDSPPPPPASGSDIVCSSAPEGVLTGFINIAMGTVHADFSSVVNCGAPMWIEVYYESGLVGRSDDVTCPSSGDSFSFDINIQTDPLFQGSTTTVVMKAVNSCGVGRSLTMGFTDGDAPPPPPSRSETRCGVPHGVVRAMAHTTSSSSQSGLTTGAVSVQYTGTVETNDALWIEVYYDAVVIGRSLTFSSPAIGETVSVNVDFHLLLGVVTSSELVVQAVSTGGAGSSITIDCVGLGGLARPDHRQMDVFIA